MVDSIKNTLIFQSLATVNGYDGQITLCNDTIILNYQCESNHVINKILITDIINVSRDYTFTLKNRLKQFPKLITKTSESIEHFTLVIYSVIPRFKRLHQLDILSSIINFHCAQKCEDWYSTIHKMLHKDSTRPKSLKVFINPIGGFKKGVELYNEKISPIFDLSEIKTTVSITSSRGEAEKHILDQKDVTVDGLVCVGGDGMLMELVQGLLIKSRNEAGYSESDHGPGSTEIPASLRIGIIPAGSTDTVAYSTIGTKDPITAALYIVLGRSVRMDILSVHCDNNFVRYNASLMGYGFYGNLVAESESLRWMGPMRYDWLGFKNFMTLEAYYGELKYLPVSKLYGDPGDGVYCTKNCERCADDPIKEQRKDWVTVRDRFVAINSFLISCRCTKSPIGPAPFAHLGNGCSDLVIVRECSRLKFLQHLLRSASYEDHFDFDFVETIRVSEFSFTELPEEKSFGTRYNVDYQNSECLPWNCDGEPLYCHNVQCKVHKQLIKVFASGIVPDSHKIQLSKSLADGNRNKKVKINLFSCMSRR